MTGCLTILLATVTASSPGTAGLPDDALLTIAERSFAEGTGLRSDSVKARRAFARSAVAFDELWQRGYRNAELSLDRSHAHRLAGDLPAAIVALHQGLAATPWSRPLQVALEDARSAVAYPLTGDLATHCRQTPSPSIGSRMSSLEAWAIAAAMWTLACGGVARYAMTRSAAWAMVASAAALALAALGFMWLQDDRHKQQANSLPLVIATEDAFLRTGNAEAFPTRLEPRLPRGVEAREMQRRGGWVQIRLASGVIGWLPERTVSSVQ